MRLEQLDNPGLSYTLLSIEALLNFAILGVIVANAWAYGFKQKRFSASFQLSAFYSLAFIFLCN